MGPFVAYDEVMLVIDNNQKLFESVLKIKTAKHMQRWVCGQALYYLCIKKDPAAHDLKEAIRKIREYYGSNDNQKVYWEMLVKHYKLVAEEQNACR